MPHPILTPTGLEFPSLDDLAAHLTVEIAAIAQYDGQLADIKPDAILINGEGPLQLDSVDGLEIAVMVNRVYGVKIQDLSSAKEVMTSITTIATHIARECAALP